MLCRCCGLEKPDDLFPKYKRVCRPCLCQKQREYAKRTAYKKTDEYRAKSRADRKNKRLSDEALARAAKSVKESKLRHPEREAARMALLRAVNGGRVTRPKNCEACGCEDQKRIDGGSSIHGHHDDYSKPLEVRWLCSICHGAVHVAAREALRAALTKDRS